MRIGVDISQAVYGTGVADYVIGLVKHLPAEELVLWGGSLRRGGEIKKLFPQAKVAAVPPTLTHWLWNQAHIWPIENLVGKVDVWHSSDWAQPPSRAKKVTTVHDLSPFMYPAEVDPQIVKVQTARMKWVVKECDQIICVSQNTAHDLRLRFKVQESRIKVIYEAVPQRFALKPQVSKYVNCLVTIGARQPRKNISRLISAFINYKTKYNLPPKLVVIGEYAKASANPDVIFTGYVSDQQLVNILAAARVFVYPTLYEGFGLPILGAFHQGVPVAAANTSSLPEVAGEAAMYFDPLNEEDMAQAIAQAFANRERLIQLGRAQLAKFSWAKAASETYQVYKSLC